jgi:hypothetical protein
MAAMETATHANGNADKPAVVPMNGVTTTPPMKLAKNQRRKQNAQNKILEKFGSQALSNNRKRPNNDTTGESSALNKSSATIIFSCRSLKYLIPIFERKIMLSRLFYCCLFSSIFASLYDSLQRMNQ